MNELKQNHEQQLNEQQTEHEKQLNTERLEHQEHIQVNNSSRKLRTSSFFL